MPLTNRTKKVELVSNKSKNKTPRHPYPKQSSTKNKFLIKTLIYFFFSMLILIASIKNIKQNIKENNVVADQKLLYRYGTAQFIDKLRQISKVV